MVVLALLAKPLFGTLLLHGIYLPKVGPMKAGCLNIAVPRKAPRPRGVA